MALLVHSCAISPSQVQTTLFTLNFLPLGHPSMVPTGQRNELTSCIVELFQGVGVVQGCPQLHTLGCLGGAAALGSEVQQPGTGCGYQPANQQSWPACCITSPKPYIQDPQLTLQQY